MGKSVAGNRFIPGFFPHLSSLVRPQSLSKITLKLLQVGTTVNNNKKLSAICQHQSPSFFSLLFGYFSRFTTMCDYQYLGRIDRPLSTPVRAIEIQFVAAAYRLCCFLCSSEADNNECTFGSEKKKKKRLTGLLNSQLCVSRYST